MCAKPTREIHGADQIDEKAPQAGLQGHCPMVPRASARPRGPTTARPQRETSRPLPVLWAPEQLPESHAALPGCPASMAQVAQPSNAWKASPVAALCPTSSSPSPATPPDHPRLGQFGESYLTNPLRQFRTMGSVRGGAGNGPAYSERHWGLGTLNKAFIAFSI